VVSGISLTIKGGEKVCVCRRRTNLCEMVSQQNFQSSLFSSISDNRNGIMKMHFHYSLMIIILTFTLEHINRRRRSVLPVCMIIILTFTLGACVRGDEQQCSLPKFTCAMSRRALSLFLERFSATNKLRAFFLAKKKNQSL
jgi:hypothetical protein